MCEVNGPQHHYLRQFFESDQLPSTCNPSVDFDREQLKSNSIINRKVWDSGLNKRIACEVGGRLKSWPTQPHSLDNHRWILRGYNQISSGVNGTTYDIDNTVIRAAPYDRREAKVNDLSIVKNVFPNISDETAQLNVMCEAYVGMKLNELRNEIPNFSMVYGLFNRQHTIIPDIVMEKITGVKDSDTFVLDLVRKPQLEQITTVLTIICQLVGAISMANERFDFTHYDLHPDNVIITDGANGKYVKYTIEGEDYYINQSHIPKVIDYGYSHIKIPEATSIPFESRFIGMEGLETYYILSSESFVMYDIWSYLSRLLLKIENVDPRLYKQLEPLIDYFYDPTENLEGFLDRNGKVLITDKGLGFIKYIISLYPPNLIDNIIKTSIGLDEIMNCSNLECDNDYVEEVPLSLIKVYRDLMSGRVDENSDPITLLDYYDYYEAYILPKISMKPMDRIDQIERDMAKYVGNKMEEIETYFQDQHKDYRKLNDILRDLSDVEEDLKWMK